MKYLKFSTYPINSHFQRVFNRYELIIAASLLLSWLLLFGTMEERNFGDFSLSSLISIPTVSSKKNTTNDTSSKWLLRLEGYGH